MVVTGATSGLGLSAAHSLATLGARVVLVGRNPGKAEQARQDVVAASREREILDRIALANAGPLPAEAIEVAAIVQVPGADEGRAPARHFVTRAAFRR